jgi:uncharacterized protein with ParB-like and HNH nuclease domain
MNKNQSCITDLLTIEEIVAGKFFRIPDYQRGYSWEKDQLHDLTEDIKHIATKSHKHYFGTIVITRSNENNHFDIVDGQQRLTTLIILLKLIYNRDPEKYSFIKERFLLRNDSDYVLETNLETKVYFKEAILEDKPNLPADVKSLQNLRDAKKYLSDWLDENDTDEILQIVTEKL